MTKTQRATQAIRAVTDAVTPARPFPRWVGLAGVILSTLAALGHDQLAAVFGLRIANLIPVLGAIAAAVSHSLNGEAKP